LLLRIYNKPDTKLVKFGSVEITPQALKVTEKLNVAAEIVAEQEFTLFDKMR
jgi:hypothetical protein